MEYQLFQTTIGMLKVYNNVNGYLYYLDIGDSFTRGFYTYEEYSEFMYDIAADYVRNGHD